MNYLLILSGYENQASFWERLTLNVPSINSRNIDFVYCEELLSKHHKVESDEEKQSWLKQVALTARSFKVEVANETKIVATFSELKKMLATAECTVFSHNILSELYKNELLNTIKGSIISFDSNFASVERCVIVFDKKVKSIQNFKKFFNHFAKAMKNTEVVFLMEIGKTLSEAAKNKKAVKYVVSLFKSVGVITCPASELQKEILRYLSLKENAVLILHKSNCKTLLETKFKENLQNRKIAYYLDEF